ncbi:MAG: lipoprotein-releasing ABC transporter permease subunit [Alphaproteobacteria bacterium]|nr:lipoprotein-releasing ABC transporter permease subunit [Alphaproteobacteria bacterium]
MLAFRYLRARREEGLISIIALFSLLGIMIGVATLIIVPAVMNGFKAELLGRILGLNGHAVVYAQQGELAAYDVLSQRLVAVEGVVRATPIVEGQVMVIANQVARGALVRGLRAEDLALNPLVTGNLRGGNLKAFRGPDAIIVGSRMAERLRLAPGSKLRLISPQVQSTVIGTLPRQRTYEVLATFESGMFEYDSTFIFMPLDAAQAFFNLDQTVTALEVLTTDPRRIDIVRPRLFAAAAAPIRITDWRQVNSHLFNAVEVERNVMFLILTLIVIVAAFNIISSLTMLVKEKGRSIAILRTMGATRGMIMRVFFIAGASIGVVGTVLGFLAGLGFCNNIETIRRWLEGLTNTDLFAAEIYFLSKLPAKVETLDVVLVFSLGLALSFLATIYPSWRASRLDPVEALRYE